MRRDGHAMGWMRIEDRRIRHVRKSVGAGRRLACLLMLWRTEVGAGPAHVVPRRWTRAHLRLWGMLSVMERYAICDRWRRGGMSQIGVIRCVLQLRGKRMLGWHLIVERRGANIVVIIII